ncbi:MAG: hypothetical protein NDI91_02780 [Sulfuritalea sp.]|nr:hypothetical protein [Sulfuritalea sp.]
MSNLIPNGPNHSPSTELVIEGGTAFSTTPLLAGEAPTAPANVKQLGNFVGGDLAGNNIYKITHVAAPITPMAKLVAQYKAEIACDQNKTSLVERLQHFFSRHTSSDVRGLEEKLLTSNRDDLIAEALIRKEAAAKLVLRYQSSPSAQMIFSHILALMVVHFEQAVRPLIQAGASRKEVDCAILTEVLSPALAALEENPLGLHQLDLQCLLYFLGGNCHIRWDKC